MINVKNIKNKGLLEHQIYWLELWEELLNKYTIEPYSTPVVNLYWLLFEEFRKNSKEEKRKKRVYKEIYKSLKKDFLAKKIKPELTNLLSYNENQYNTFIYRIQNMKYFKEDEYFSAVAFELYTMLSSKNEIDIKNLEFLTKNFIAGLINRKFSWYYLQQRASILIENRYFKEANFQFRLNYFFSNLLKNRDEWDVLFKLTLKKDVLTIGEYSDIVFLSSQDSYIRNKIEQLNSELKNLQNNLEDKKEKSYDKYSSQFSKIDDLKKFNFYIENISKEIMKIKSKKSFLEKSDGKIFALVKNIKASDPYAIQKIAKNHLLRFINAIRYNSPNIFFHSNSIDTNTLILKNPKNNLSILVPKENLSNTRKNLKFRLEDIDKHFNYINKSKNPKIKYDFQDIMHFYGMYLDAQYDSEKFLSLWIALEKLSDINEDENVSEFVATIVSIYHLKKILRNLWKDIERLELSNIFIDEFKINKDDKNQIKEEELFFLIKLKSKEILEKINEKSNSKIIYMRVDNLSKIFKSANNLSSYINDYKFNTENNLWRLYAIRNKIAHEAYIDIDLTVYINQLEYFFKITYNNLLYMTSLKRYDSINSIIKEYVEKYKMIWENQNGFIFQFLKDFEPKSKKVEVERYFRDFKYLIIDPM